MSSVYIVPKEQTRSMERNPGKMLGFREATCLGGAHATCTTYIIKYMLIRYIRHYTTIVLQKIDNACWSFIIPALACISYQCHNYNSASLYFASIPPQNPRTSRPARRSRTTCLGPTVGARGCVPPDLATRPKTKLRRPTRAKE